MSYDDIFPAVHAATDAEIDEITEREETVADTTVYQTAEKIAAGQPQSAVAAREVAAELLRVRGVIAEAMTEPYQAGANYVYRLACEMGLER